MSSTRIRRIFGARNTAVYPLNTAIFESLLHSSKRIWQAKRPFCNRPSSIRATHINSAPRGTINFKSFQTPARPSGPKILPAPRPLIQSHPASIEPRNCQRGCPSSCSKRYGSTHIGSPAYSWSRSWSRRRSYEESGGFGLRVSLPFEFAPHLSSSHLEWVRSKVRPSSLPALSL